MKARMLDHGKNVLIALLLLCIIALTLMALPPSVVQTWRLPTGLLRVLGIPAGAEPLQPVRSTQSAAAAQPLLISVRTKTGRSSAQRRFSALDQLRDQMTPLLGEALQTAHRASTVRPSAFYAALARESVYFDYGTALPVSAVGAWLGAENDDLNGEVRRFLLAEQGGKVELYLFGDACLRYATELSAESFLKAIEDCTPDGSAFYAEEDSDAAAPLMLREGAVSLPNAAAEFPEEDGFAESVATLLNFNPYGTGAYTETDGSRVFTENNRVCSVGKDGSVVFTDSKEAPSGPSAEMDSLSAKIETARALISSIDALSTNDARLYLCGCEEDGEVTRCRFRYVLEGVPILPDAVTATFYGTHLTELRFSVRVCYTVASSISLLPLPQALAIAEPGASLTVAYHDNARGTLTAGWVQD